ncbi:MAG TPA: polysaccharide biosynthesis protein, partial [Gammaproteobacteria bacterium]|nr:polysaccharide biosynthesis protein [Gammaproteobacteria bacterium]
MKSSSARYQLPSAIKQLANLPRSGRQLLMLMLDIVALASLSWLALYLALNEPSPVKMGDGIWLCLLAPALSIPIFVRVGLYRAVVRYIGTRIIQTAVNAVTLATIAITLLGIFLIADAIPSTTYFIYWSLAVLYMTLSRLYLRNWYLVFMGTSEDCRRIIVYGAGHAGMQLATSLQTSRLYRPVAFVDDSEKLHGHIVQDLVVRSPADLPQLVEHTEADLIALALPSVTHQRRQNIVKELEHLPIEVKTVPSLTDLMSG